MDVPEKRSANRKAPFRASKRVVDELLATEKQFNRTGTNFLKVDVATALTFSQNALNAKDAEKKRRNQRAARRAYDTVIKLSKKVTVSQTEKKELYAGLQQLRANLAALGETF